MEPLILAITGASGVIYGQRLLQVLVEKGTNVHLLISPAGRLVIEQELGISLNLEDFDLAAFLRSDSDLVKYFHYADIGCEIASGSYPTSGMIIAPASMDTVGAVASGLAGNLILRAADVTLKEGRKLILVPRETPLTLIHLENLARLARAGATILPAMPGFYKKPRKIDDLALFLVGKILDALGQRFASCPSSRDSRARGKDAQHPKGETVRQKPD
jgi:4-hydroxy-3-polyprenylbenzoate decarboxylase